MSFFGALVMLIFWIVAFLLIYFVVKHLTDSDKSNQVIGKSFINDIKSPLDIAKERYAKGEITKDELEEIKKNLV